MINVSLNRKVHSDWSLLDFLDGKSAPKFFEIVKSHYSGFIHHLSVFKEVSLEGYEDCAEIDGLARKLPICHKRKLIYFRVDPAKKIQLRENSFLGNETFRSLTQYPQYKQFACFYTAESGDSELLSLRKLEDDCYNIGVYDNIANHQIAKSLNLLFSAIKNKADKYEFHIDSVALMPKLELISQCKKKNESSKTDQKASNLPLNERLNRFYGTDPDEIFEQGEVDELLKDKELLDALCNG